LRWLFLLQLLLLSGAFTKVLVSAVYREWENSDAPAWAVDPAVMEKYGYSVFLYQKLDPTKPNYFGFNRGAEAGTYFKYIVDFYDNFPDVAIFVHADPSVHSTHWLERIGCLSPNVSYMSINNQHWVTRSPSYWKKIELWNEQCWRDTLQIAWGLESDDAEFHRRLPPQQDIIASAQCCNQFAVSRAQIRSRPIRMWKQLLNIFGLQDACHYGEPDYEHLYWFNQTGRVRVGPEPAHMTLYGEHPVKSPGYGRLTQAVTLEHLAHVVFGGKPLDMEVNGECAAYIPGCQVGGRALCPG